MVFRTGFGLARMKNGGFGVKGNKLGSVTSRHQVPSRQPCNFFKESQLFSFEQLLYFSHNFVCTHPN